MKKDLKDYVKKYPPKEKNVILCNMAGLEWQICKDGEVLSDFPHYIDESTTMVASNNSDAYEDSEKLKKMFVAIFQQNIYNSIDTMNKLAKKAGYDDFDIDMDYVVEELRLPPDIKIG